MTGTEIFKRSATFDRDSETIRLHAPQWKLLLAYDGQRSLAEVALSVGMSFAETIPLTEKFLAEDWIEEQPITLDQYLKRTGAASASATGAAVTPSVVLHEAKPAASGPALEPAPPVAAAVEAAAPRPAIPPPPVARPASPPPLKASAQVVPAPPAQPAVRPPGPMRLKAVVDYIVAQVGNSSLGQLVVYRVFLRVPPQLLQAEEIASVHLLNDQSVVKTDELKQAIASSVMEVLKRPLPESLLAAA